MTNNNEPDNWGRRLSREKTIRSQSPTSGSTKETLSDKIEYYETLDTKHVKQFIKELKEEMKGLKGEEALKLILNKLAGDKLI